MYQIIKLTNETAGGRELPPYSHNSACDCNQCLSTYNKRKKVFEQEKAEQEEFLSKHAVPDLSIPLNGLTVSAFFAILMAVFLLGLFLK